MKITADEGKYLTDKNKTFFAKEILLGASDSQDNYIQITEEEAKDIMFVNDTKNKVQTLEDLDNFNNEAKVIPKIVNSVPMSNKEALDRKEMFPVWEIGIDVVKGDKYHHIVDDKLYECDQNHKTQEDWSPDKMSSLWHEVTEHEGSIDDPIPYNEDKNPLWQGMILEEGKYYIQDGIKYKCTRNTEIKVTQDLSALVGIYVELAE